PPYVAPRPTPQIHADSPPPPPAPPPRPRPPPPPGPRRPRRRLLAPPAGLRLGHRGQHHGRQKLPTVAPGLRGPALRQRGVRRPGPSGRGRAPPRRPRGRTQPADGTERPTHQRARLPAHQRAGPGRDSPPRDTGWRR